MYEYYPPQHLKNRGFSLSEILIALGLLGLIAVFTIPKVLDSTTNAQKKAVFTEVIQLLNEALVKGVLSGDWQNPSSEAYLEANVKHVKFCFSDADGNGCYPPGATYIAWVNDGQGMVFHNGAMLMGIQDTSSTCNGFAVDWNGLAGPNTEGDDQLVMYVGFNGPQTGVCAGSDWEAKNNRIGPRAGSAVSMALWDEIFVD